tara:strand:- start:4986 stop:5195 length:210 start_codon:yes stop_codon:yes gene_type:complete
MGTCGGGKPYKRMSDNPKMNGEGGDVRRPYITGGLVGPAMEYSDRKKRDDEDDEEDKKKKRDKSYGTGM